ncbi:MAG: PilN domain-containing protein [Pseudomonadota bacterium]|nr:PilN domain-containing protein [Pseudomonadota bacterium]
MIRINLLPIRQTRKLEAARLELSLALVGGFLVVLLAGATWGFLTYELSDTRAENAQFQAEIDRLATVVTKVDEMEKFKAELERKLAVIQGLRDKKAGPVHMLDEIALSIPDKLFLTKVEEERGELRITGVSVSNDVISQFLRGLEDSAYFEQVYLQDIEAMAPEKNLSLTLKTFKLTAKLVTPKTVSTTAPGTTQGASAPGGAVPAAGAVPVPADAPAPAPAETTSPAPTPAAAPAPAATPAPAPAPEAAKGGGA